jgi:hypothetical protein
LDTGWECFPEGKEGELQERWPWPVELRDRERATIVIFLKMGAWLEAATNGLGLERDM